MLPRRSSRNFGQIAPRYLSFQKRSERKKLNKIIAPDVARITPGANCFYQLKRRQCVFVFHFNTRFIHKQRFEPSTKTKMLTKNKTHSSSSNPFTNGADDVHPPNLTLDEINADIDGAFDDSQQQTNPNGFQSLFVRKPANVWIDEAKTRPIPKMLFGELWHEGELCILFADTGVGKSILSVQIADSLTANKQLGFFKMTAKPNKVLYFDFELSDKMFEARYSTTDGQSEFYTNHYKFNPNFERLEINADDAQTTLDFEQYLNISLSYEIAESKAEIIIVDNITYLGTETEKSRFALPLMKFLKSLAKRFKVSILALAHTPKRDFTKPLTVNDLGGSKHLSNFCDSVFAIGKSYKDENLRYIKQIKPRNSPLLYGEHNVCICEIRKDENFIKFEFLKFDSESEHLKTLTDAERKDAIARVKDLHADGKTQREIAFELGLSVGTVNAHIKKI